ncbi:MAG: UPF0182 family protein, partial [Pyrinomonadaceae bacterium]
MSEDRGTVVPGDFGGHVIDINPVGKPRRRRRRGLWLLVLALIALLFGVSRASAIYIDTLWFGSLGYGTVYWTTLKYEVALFLVFALATIIILRGAFWLLERTFDVSALAPRRMMLNNQPVSVAPARLLKPAAWVVALFFGLSYGIGMSDEWQTFALWLNRPQTGDADAVFSKPVGFYLFTLPFASSVVSWLLMLAFIILCAALAYALLAALPAGAGVEAFDAPRRKSLPTGARRAAYTAVSTALAALLTVLALRVYLSRFTYLFDDHTIFSGVTYTEDHYVLPGLTIVCVALLVAAAVALLNAFALRRARVLAFAVGLPVLVFLLAVVAVPAYVQSYIVKPNELDREAPYIERNIAATRRAFNLEQVEARDFPAETATEAYALDANH